MRAINLILALTMMVQPCLAGNYIELLGYEGVEVVPTYPQGGCFPQDDYYVKPGQQEQFDWGYKDQYGDQGQWTGDPNGQIFQQGNYTPGGMIFSGEQWALNNLDAYHGWQQEQYGQQTQQNILPGGCVVIPQHRRRRRPMTEYEYRLLMQREQMQFERDRMRMGMEYEDRMWQRQAEEMKRERKRQNTMAAIGMFSATLMCFAATR